MKRTMLETRSSAGVTIRCTLLQQGADRLLVRLPGVSRSNAVMEYIEQLGEDLGYDLLEIPYAFHIAQTDFHMAQIPDIRQETRRILEQALEAGYESVVLVGKSLGTMLAVSLAQDVPRVRKLLLLTPVQNAHTMTGDLPTLAVIGTADSRYDPAMIVESDTLKWLVYEGMDHGLKIPGSVRATLHYLPEMLATCEEFLRT